jgi:hypothetical protein
MNPKYREKNAARQRMTYHMRKDNHQCVRCGMQDERTLAGRTTCDWCSRKIRLMTSEIKERRRLMYHQNKAAGVCVVCGAPRDNKTLRCERCRQRANHLTAESMRRRRERERNGV